MAEEGRRLYDAPAPDPFVRVVQKTVAPGQVQYTVETNLLGPPAAVAEHMQTMLLAGLRLAIESAIRTAMSGQQRIVIPAIALPGQESTNGAV